MFLPIDLADEVELEIEDAAETRIALEVVAVRGHPSLGRVPSGEDNLVVRAARAFLEAAGVMAQVQIRLAKRVPSAAGLGGGSSDAGAVLRALAGRYPGAVSAAGLEALAVGLGADVPFFLDPSPARMTGIGERRAPLSGALPAFDVLLANPGEALATADVFRAFADASPTAQSRALGPDLAEVLAQPGGAGLAQLLENDLEPAAAGLCPAIAALRAALEGAGALAVGLSGSGATLFGVFDGPEAAAAAAESLRPEVSAQSWLRVARTAESR